MLEAGYAELTHSAPVSFMSPFFDSPLLPRRRGRADPAAAALLQYCDYAVPPRCVCDTAAALLRLYRSRQGRIRPRLSTIVSYIIRLSYQRCNVAIDPKEIMDYFGVSFREFNRAAKILDMLGVAVKEAIDNIYNELMNRTLNYAEELGVKVDPIRLHAMLQGLRRRGFAIGKINVTAAALLKYYCTSTGECSISYKQLAGVAGTSIYSIAKKYSKVKRLA